MAFFHQAQGVQVSGSQFTTITNTTTATTNITSGPTGIDILREASALGAIHDSSARPYPPKCFPGTREQYIQDIVGRTTPSLDDTPPPIYWMKGPAGVGKSAIAQTCAERLAKKEALGASFFFSISGQRHPDKFFPSIAYQLATRHPAYRDLVDNRISQDKALVSKAMRFQFQYLIDEPLRDLEKNGKGIKVAFHVFVDGLDECEGTDAQCEIIQIIATSACEGVLPLRWAFFSRPEPHILASFSEPSVAPHCYKVELPISRDADGEIELYLRSAFDNILKRSNPSTMTLWPSNEEIRIIVLGAGGSFIFATTVVRFVGRPDSLSPQKRLLAVIDIALYPRPASPGKPLAELDAFYTLILQRIPSDIFQSVRLLLAFMCQMGGSGAAFAANALMMSREEFEATCHHVSAVIRFNKPGRELELGPSIDTTRAYTQAKGAVSFEVFVNVLGDLGGHVSFYHKSFLDFLRDPARSGNYCARDSRALANHFVKLRLDYDQSFSWCGPELVLAPGVPDSAASLSYPHTNEFTNSILKAGVYSRATGGTDYFWVAQEIRGLNADCDFRKLLYILTVGPNPRYPWVHSWGEIGSQRHNFWGGYLEYTPPGNFPNFAITKFKLMIKRHEQAHRIQRIQRHHPNFSSRIKSLFHNKPLKDVESALYLMGGGEKSIFWYWEINRKLESYRGFYSIDLAEGEKRFREEDFGSWPEYDPV